MFHCFTIEHKNRTGGAPDITKISIGKCLGIVKALDTIDAISTTEDDASDRDRGRDYPYSIHHNNGAENAST